MAELRGALKMLTLACAHTASDCWSLSALRSAALRYALRYGGAALLRE